MVEFKYFADNYLPNNTFTTKTIVKQSRCLGNVTYFLSNINISDIANI